MELKLFGKSIFQWKSSKGDLAWGNALNQIKDSKHLEDFYDLQGNSSFESDAYIRLETLAEAVDTKTPVKKQKPKKVIERTPKEIYHAKTLNDNGYTLNCDLEYIDAQLADFKDKLAIIKSTPDDMRRGVREIASVIARLENRKKYREFAEFYEEYPYTTTSKVNELLKSQSYLKMGKVEQFLADMPKEAVKTMKEYTKTTEKLCGKKPLFYIIANKKDFQKSNTRRDPILLAQSPFAHVWQILGAWDEEMLFLEEL